MRRADGCIETIHDGEAGRLRSGQSSAAADSSLVERRSEAHGRRVRALLLQVLYSIRSERMLMKQISYNMLFRWFVGLAMDDARSYFGGALQRRRHVDSGVGGS